MTGCPENQQFDKAGMDKIHQLQKIGVTLAEGEGSMPQRLLVLTAVCVSCGLLLINGVTDPVFFALLPVVVITIDFLSGCVHWFFDSQVEPSESFVGRIAIDFLDHHVRPGRTAEVGFFVSAHRPALFVTLPLVTLSTVLTLPVMVAAAIFWTGFFSMLVPQTHKEAHLYEHHPVMAWLQKSRLILHPVSHQKHHDDNRQCYCVFTGWLNPVLDRIRFWRLMERVFNALRAR
jgi:ubiquitin-conjugating enzyme E2 variant